MKRIPLTIVVAAILMLALKGSYTAQSAATIEGVVLDAATKQPLAGVRVGLSGITPVAFNPLGARVPPTEATTDAQGHFALETKEIGRFRVVPTKNGYIYSRSGQTRAPTEPGVWVQVSPGARIQGLELRMARPAVISGRVLDAEGRPLIGNAGTVNLVRYTYGADGKRGLGDVPGIPYGAGNPPQRMNDQGDFRFYDLPPGEYYLTVTGGGGAIGSARSYFYPGVTDEPKAIPIPVRSGDDVRLGTLTLLPRQKGVEVKLLIAGTADSIIRSPQVYIADSALVYLSPPIPVELVFSVAPGHYDTVVTSGLFTSMDFHYAFVRLDIGNSNVDQEVVLKPGAAVTGKLLLETEAGKRSAAPPSIRCRLRSHYGLPNCVGSRVVPGVQELDFQGLPPDAYVLSAKVGDRDILAEGLNITGDTELEIVLASPGAIVQGTVRDAGGDTVPSAAVALVPDAPYRGAGPLYRSVIADPNGKFEIHGIAPGSYKLFAGPELEGAAYRNSDFMKEFDDRGKAVKIEKGSRLSVDVTAF